MPGVQLLLRNATQLAEVVDLDQREIYAHRFIHGTKDFIKNTLEPVCHLLAKVATHRKQTFIAMTGQVYIAIGTLVPPTSSYRAF